MLEYNKFAKNDGSIQQGHSDFAGEVAPESQWTRVSENPDVYVNEWLRVGVVCPYEFAIVSDNGDGTGEWVPATAAIQDSLEASERSWRDTELAWYDNYQKNAKWSSLCCIDQEALYRYYIALLEYPQSVDFPDGTRPSKPALLCDEEKTPVERWEGSVQLELNARRLSPVTINNVLVGSSGSEIATTLLISPTVTGMANMSAYVTESVINGLVDVAWDTDGTGQVQLTVQNLKPVFKALEGYVSNLHKSMKILNDDFGGGADIRDDVNWPAQIVTL